MLSELSSELLLHDLEYSPDVTGESVKFAAKVFVISFSPLWFPLILWFVGYI